MKPVCRVGRLCLTLLLVLSAGGCARFPEAPQVAGVRRLIVEIQVAGRIRPDYSYFVLFNLSNDPDGREGPLPVVVPPWGNGFAGGAFTHFVRFDQIQPGVGYGLYRVVPNTNLQVFEYLGVPLNAEPVGAESNRLRFEIDIVQFISDVPTAREMRFIQLNLLATDRVPTDPNDLTPKNWDALGDGRLGTSQYLNLRIDQNRILRNSDVGPAVREVEGDVRDPDLDIVDWRLEVRSL